MQPCIDPACKTNRPLSYQILTAHQKLPRSIPQPTVWPSPFDTSPMEAVEIHTLSLVMVDSAIQITAKVMPWTLESCSSVAWEVTIRMLTTKLGAINDLKWRKTWETIHNSSVVTALTKTISSQEMGTHWANQVDLRRAVDSMSGSMICRVEINLSLIFHWAHSQSMVFIRIIRALFSSIRVPRLTRDIMLVILILATKTSSSPRKINLVISVLSISWLQIRIWCVQIKLTAPKCSEFTGTVSREVHLISRSNHRPCLTRTRGLMPSIDWQDIRIAWTCACHSPSLIHLRVNQTKVRRLRCIERRDLHLPLRNLRSKESRSQVRDPRFSKALKALVARRFWPAPIKPTDATTQYSSKTIQWLSCMMKLMRRLWSQMWIWETLWPVPVFTRLR